MQHTPPSLSYDFCKTHGILLNTTEQGELEILCLHSVNHQSLNEIKRLCTGQSVKFKAISTDEFEQLIQNKFANQNRSSSEVLDRLEEDIMSFSDIASALEEPEDLLNSEDDAPIIRLLNSIFFEAIRENASDVHIEPYEKIMHIRFRLDGVLKDVLTTKSQVAPLLVSRIKVLAKLDIAEKRVPQDGRLSLKLGGKAIDLRVSTIPAAYGERVVLRLLNKEKSLMDLTNLGMPTELLEQFIKIINLPHGIILVTGPTGSGKTTTLYSALKKMDSSRLNIMTVEDPIEYYFDNISQTQVNTKAGMTFAKGLRAILRQDPDVVLIGEIRDPETANISIQASLTGHLVLSTLHTNTAIGAITRLKDIGVEPFLLSSTVVAVLAQRLVRRLCASCKVAYHPDEFESATLGLDQSTKLNQTELYQAKGCNQCYNSGYKGRIAIYELINIDGHCKKLINENASETEIEQYLRTQSLSLAQSGFALVKDGKTSFAEVVRITQI